MKRGIDFIRTRDVINTSAQSTTLCGVYNIRMTEEYSSDMWFSSLCDYSERVAMVYLLQKRFALRISEALSISPKNITSKGSIVIKGLKGSNDKLIDLPELRNYFIECRNNGVYPFNGLSRFAVYRIYKKFLINNNEFYGCKVAVTHGFRYQKVREIQEIEKDFSLSKIVLGHKSISSTEHYAKGK